MAPVYDFRHVELDKIGRGKRIVKPPGGECSNIFGSEERLDGVCSTPRKSNKYMQSTIFGGADSPDCPSTPSTPGTPKSTSSLLLDTQERLFGPLDETPSPRKVVNRLRSSIFEEEAHMQPKSTPVRRPSLNPITGDPMSVQTNGGGHTNGGAVNGNGYTNGHCNGHGTPVNGSATPRGRTPPGGKSSGIFF